MQFSKWTAGAVVLLALCMPLQGEAQTVKNERLLSFEEESVPEFITATTSQLTVSGDHYLVL